MGTVTKPGFYDGVFRKAGQHASDEAIAAASADAGAEKLDLDKMSKDELIAEAERRGVEISSGATKAQIVEALNAA
ncbi:hypothetical protein [Palleronia sp.]|uniref:hypothetical protein n=1 Tax=Palleronia sp. TaxID=1940284 RepID=UPI0035C818EC